MKAFIIAALVAAVPGAVLAQGQAVSPKVVQEAQAAQSVQRAQAAQAQGGTVKAPRVEAVEKILADASGLIRLTGEDPRIDVDLENASPREALKQIFERAKLDYQVDEGALADTKISLRAKNIRFLTALELVLQSAGAGVVREVRDGKGSFRIRKGGVGEGLTALQLLHPATIGGFFAADGKKGQIPALKYQEYLKAFPNNTVTPYLFQFNEQRSTFRCPHCKGQSTVLRQPQQPKCEKCNRVFQPDWQFCPADGTKRPTPAVEWRYCPFCGKRTEGEKSGAEPSEKGANPLSSEFNRQF